jgi:hypothetical protein
MTIRAEHLGLACGGSAEPVPKAQAYSELPLPGIIPLSGDSLPTNLAHPARPGTNPHPGSSTDDLTSLRHHFTRKQKDSDRPTKRVAASGFVVHWLAGGWRRSPIGVHSRLTHFPIVPFTHFAMMGDTAVTCRAVRAYLHGGPICIIALLKIGYWDSFRTLWLEKPTEAQALFRGTCAQPIVAPPAHRRRLRPFQGLPRVFLENSSWLMRRCGIRSPAGKYCLDFPVSLLFLGARRA